ncbi:MAG: hypothetical protein JXA81_12515 [Sedimentisphaerales bacterium]|nr:hypothetical protein [Sedimentisphaerales bacterium]
MFGKMIWFVAVLLVLGICTDAVLAELIGYWPFEEGQGTATTDVTGNGNDGMFNGSVDWVSGYIGKGVHFDDDGDRIVVGPIDPTAGTEAMTLAAWINWEGLNHSRSQQGIIGKRLGWDPGTNIKWYWQTNPAGDLLFRADAGDGGAGMGWGNTALVPYANEWTHVALTWDDDDVVQYINGEEVSTGNITFRDTADETPVSIGCVSSTNTETFVGSIDEVYIFNNALPQAQIQDLANGIIPVFPKARWPQPEDDAALWQTWASFSWEPGDGAASHDVYLGDSFADVNEGTGETFRVNQTELFYFAGIFGYPYPDGLVPGTTYYWRIDEVEADGVTKHKGDVWSFFISPKKAYNPNPIDGAGLIATDVTLSYAPGFGVKVHHIFFGENFADVEDGTPDTYKGPVVLTSFVPGELDFNKTYYWRVDEFDGVETRKGDVWSFQTTPLGLGAVVLEIWDNIAGGSLSDLTGDSRYPAQPDSTQSITELAWDPDADNYGGRIYGWLYPPQTGDYIFWIASDNDSELWLSTNDDPENVELIASISGWTGANEWNKFASQMSEPVSLTTGSKYYVMAIWVEGTGGDHCIVAWQGPGIEKRTIIAGDYLSPYEPVSAYGPNPGDGAVGVKRAPTLTWKPGIQAASHEIYFGTDEEAVRNATMASPEYVGPLTLGSESYEPGKLAWESTYYWRIDEVNELNPDSPWKGNVWSFTSADFLIIDDFEDYDAGENQIWYAWHDGLGYGSEATPPYYAGNGTGAAVGDETTPSYTEETIVHGGGQSMPLFYDNNKQGYANYSETELTLTDVGDWTEENVAELSLWFRGYPASVGSFVESPAGTYTITASGADITGTSDEFHFAYKTLTGPGSIIAKVESVQNTNQWAKAGVMIRETLDPGSAHAMVFITPGQGVVFEYRPLAGDNNLGAAGQQTGVTAPYWVKLERSLSGSFTASYSANGTSFQPIPNTSMANIQMNANVYIGLAVTAHDVTQTCQAVFSNVTFTGTVGPQWMNQDIGVASNDPEPMYVAVTNSGGVPAVVYHDDPAAAQIDVWTEWVIPLQVFADQGINLTDVDRIAIGLGTKGNISTPGGSGKMYFDDIRLYRTRNTP